MTDVIQLLPDSVANQIAAGEVIQRPASVIKELVENAVDAGAHTVNVLVVDAGRTSMQVIDDGCGMSETDARLAFERHATSKIRKADDLFALHTMGFRGEALPSIVAVSQVELRTRRQEDEIGTCLVLSGSRVESQEPCSCAVGSSFLVSNLFFNVPARRKFLKTNATELNNILTAFERIVLVYPDINFTLHSNGQELMNLRAGSLRQRISDVYGRRYGQELLPVSVETAMCKISGFVAKPEAARKKGVAEYFFVNGRFMKHPYFHKAVQQAYDRLIPTGMHVPYFIYFEVSPADIDVNIHPTKTEIKFENEQPVWQILSAAVKDAIGRFCDIPSIDFDTEGRPDIPVFDPQQNHIEIPRVSYNPSYNPFSSPKSRPSAAPFSDFPSPGMDLVTAGTGGASPGTDLATAGTGGTSPGTDFASPEVGVGSASLGVGSTAALPQSPGSLFDEPAAPALPFTEKSPVHYQYKGRYIMTAVKSGLMIIDQYRASLRILFEKYISQSADRSFIPQRVLFPEAVQFTAAEETILRELLPLLSGMGFELTDLGGGSYAVNAIPSGVDGDPVSLVRNIVDETIEKGGAEVTSPGERLALSLARATAVPYGQLLTNEEMEALTNQLFSCSNVNYTPDGRAILCIFPQSDIEHLLG